MLCNLISLHLLNLFSRDRNNEIIEKFIQKIQWYNFVKNETNYASGEYFYRILLERWQKNSTNFCKHLKNFTLIFAPGKNFHNFFFAHLLKKFQKISQIKKNFIKYFRILMKTEKGFSCTVNN